MLAGPFVPEVQLWWHGQRLQSRIDELITDLARASDSLETYRPLSELTQALGMREDLAEAPAEPMNGHVRERS
jgi:hypothetical protein